MLLENISRCILVDPQSISQKYTHTVWVDPGMTFDVPDTHQVRTSIDASDFYRSHV